MATTTKELLNSLLRELSRVTGNQDLDIEHAYGSVRLTNAKHSVDISPLLSKRELERYIRAMIKGAEMAKHSNSLALDVEAIINADSYGQLRLDLFKKSADKRLTSHTAEDMHTATAIRDFINQ